MPPEPSIRAGRAAIRPPSMHELLREAHKLGVRVPAVVTYDELKALLSNAYDVDSGLPPAQD